MQWITIKERYPLLYTPVLVFSYLRNAALFVYVSKNPENKNDENLYWETPELPDGSKIYSLIMAEDLWMHLLLPLKSDNPKDLERI